MKILTRNQLLQAEVARRLAAAGAPADAQAVDETIRSIREDAVALLSRFAFSLVECAEADCRCPIAATVYYSLAQELREAS